MHAPSQETVADDITKSLPQETFAHLRNLIGMGHTKAGASFHRYRLERLGPAGVHWTSLNDQSLCTFFSAPLVSHASLFFVSDNWHDHDQCMCMAGGIADILDF